MSKKGTIKLSEQRKLHSKSGNRCAICKTVLVDVENIDSTCIGVNAHIYGEKPGAARYDATKPIYIIELKKDSGYDDAYKQTASYLDWFESNDISKGKNVYGIICLNSPTKDLIEKVRKDKRMKLFEYQISYTEI